MPPRSVGHGCGRRRRRHTLITLDAGNTVLLVGLAFADFDAPDVLIHEGMPVG
jgi:hypothetical protein